MPEKNYFKIIPCLKHKDSFYEIEGYNHIFYEFKDAVRRDIEVPMFGKEGNYVIHVQTRFYNN